MSASDHAAQAPISDATHDDPAARGDLLNYAVGEAVPMTIG